MSLGRTGVVQRISSTPAPIMPPATVMDCTRRRMTMAAVSQPEAARPWKKEPSPAASSRWKGCGSYFWPNSLISCGGDLVAADGVELLADVEVLEVKLLGHGAVSPDALMLEPADDGSKECAAVRGEGEEGREEA